LSTRDLLSLSEAAAWLVPFREQHRSLRLLSADEYIGRHGTMAVLPAALARLVARQSRLEHLQVDDAAVLPLSPDAGEGEGFLQVGTGTRLRHLRLSRLRRGGWEARRLGLALRMAAWPGLEHLAVATTGVGCPGLRHAVMALADGACPLLTRLELKYETWALGDQPPGDDVAEALAAAMAAGGLRACEELALSGVMLSPAGVAALAMPGREAFCPRLTCLRLCGAGVGVGAARALARAMGRGALEPLQTLDLAENPLRDEGLLALAAAWRLGAGRGLRVLGLGAVEAGNVGVVGLAQAMKEGALPGLHVLILANNRKVRTTGVQSAESVLVSRVSVFSLVVPKCPPASRLRT
jgi:hypothetical protein